MWNVTELYRYLVCDCERASYRVFDHNRTEKRERRSMMAVRPTTAQSTMGRSPSTGPSRCSTSSSSSSSSYSSSSSFFVFLRFFGFLVSVFEDQVTGRFRPPVFSFFRHLHSSAAIFSLSLSLSLLDFFGGFLKRRK